MLVVTSTVFRASSFATRYSANLRLCRLQPFRRVSTGSSTEILPGAPLFRQIPPWWARPGWTGGILLCNVVFFANWIHITWNYWTKEVELPPREASSTETSPPNAKPETTWELRPIWQRAGVCAAATVTGCAFTAWILFTRLRLVQSLNITPRLSEAFGSGNRKLTIKSASDFGKGDTTVPLSSCTLMEGRDKDELLVTIKGRGGSWQIQMNGPEIDGKPTPSNKARSAILKEWKQGGKVDRDLLSKAVSKVTADSRWKKGPIRTS